MMHNHFLTVGKVGCVTDKPRGNLVISQLSLRCRSQGLPRIDSLQKRFSWGDTREDSLLWDFGGADRHRLLGIPRYLLSADY